LLPLLRFSVQLLLAGSVCAAIPLAFYSQEITELLYPAFAEQRTGYILFFLAFSFIAQSLNYAYGALLSATGFIGRMNKIYALGILLNLGGNLLALPRYGAASAAAVTLVTQGFVAITQAILAHRWHKLAGTTVPWFRILLFSTFLASCGLALIYFHPLNWFIECLLLGTFGVVVAVLLGLIDLKQLSSLTK
jgi:O-antigen/teichoic acid export membrane protein